MERVEKVRVQAETAYGETSSGAVEVQYLWSTLQARLLMEYLIQTQFLHHSELSLCIFLYTFEQRNTRAEVQVLSRRSRRKESWCISCRRRSSSCGQGCIILWRKIINGGRSKMNRRGGGGVFGHCLNI